MSALNIPLHYESQRRYPDGRTPYTAHLVIDAGDVQVCEVATREEAEQIIAAVNSDAEHAEDMRKLRGQRDALLKACKAVATECPSCGGTDLRDDLDDNYATMWCYECGECNNHARLARDAIAAAEGGE